MGAGRGSGVVRRTAARRRRGSRRRGELAMTAVAAGRAHVLLKRGDGLISNEGRRSPAAAPAARGPGCAAAAGPARVTTMALAAWQAIRGAALKPPRRMTRRATTRPGDASSRPRGRPPLLVRWVGVDSRRRSAANGRTLQKPPTSFGHAEALNGRSSHGLKTTQGVHYRADQQPAQQNAQKSLQIAG